MLDQTPLQLNNGLGKAGNVRQNDYTRNSKKEYLHVQTNHRFGSRKRFLGCVFGTIPFGGCRTNISWDHRLRRALDRRYPRDLARRHERSGALDQPRP